MERCGPCWPLMTSLCCMDSGALLKTQREHWFMCIYTEQIKFLCHQHLQLNDNNVCEVVPLPPVQPGGAARLMQPGISGRDALGFQRWSPANRRAELSRLSHCDNTSGELRDRAAHRGAPGRSAEEPQVRSRSGAPEALVGCYGAALARGASS